MTPRMSSRRATLVSGLLLAAVSATGGAVVAQPWAAVADPGRDAPADRRCRPPGRADVRRARPRFVVLVGFVLFARLVVIGSGVGFGARLLVGRLRWCACRRA